MRMAHAKRAAKVLLALFAVEVGLCLGGANPLKGARLIRETSRAGKRTGEKGGLVQATLPLAHSVEGDGDDDVHPFPFKMAGGTCEEPRLEGGDPEAFAEVLQAMDGASHDATEAHSAPRALKIQVGAPAVRTLEVLAGETGKGESATITPRGLDGRGGSKAIIAEEGESLAEAGLPAGLTLTRIDKVEGGTQDPAETDQAHGFRGFPSRPRRIA